MIAAVVLAAGESSRLGRPKQLVAFRGRSLIRGAVEAALGGGCSPVIVVLGARAERVRREIDPRNVRAVVNPAWREGMAGSIRVGLAELEASAGDAEAVVLMGCDQPHLSADVLRRLLEAYRGRKDATATMAACAYAGTLGTPALFSRVEFGRLVALDGDRGARDLLRAETDRVVRISWPDGARDVDVPGDVPGPACGDTDAAL
jgi:molybdenum cofactor cytidylyltransferase